MDAQGVNFPNNIVHVVEQILYRSGISLAAQAQKRRILINSVIKAWNKIQTSNYRSFAWAYMAL